MSMTMFPATRPLCAVLAGGVAAGAKQRGAEGGERVRRPAARDKSPPLSPSSYTFDTPPALPCAGYMGVHNLIRIPRSR